MSNYHFMTLKEVATILKLDSMTIYRYIKKGDLIAHKFGKTYRITQDDFIKFLEFAKKEAMEANKKHRSCITPQSKKAVKAPKTAKVAKNHTQTKKQPRKQVNQPQRKAKNRFYGCWNYN